MPPLNQIGGARVGPRNTSEMTNRIMNTTNKIQATSEEIAATWNSPKAPAMRAMIKNAKAMLNMTSSFCS